MRCNQGIHLMRWIVSLLSLTLLIVFCPDTQEARGQTISLRMRLPSRGVSSRGELKRMLRKGLRARLMQRGFVIKPMRSIRNGYHLEVALGIEEEFSSSAPARCTIQIAAQIVVLPAKRLVMRATSSGSSHFSRATSYSRKKRTQLRRLAMNKAVSYFAQNLRGHFKRIERRKRTLGKNRILGKRWRGGSRRASSGSGKRKGRPLPGRQPKLKSLPAGLDAHRHRPPLF